MCERGVLSQNSVMCTSLLMGTLSKWNSLAELPRNPRVFPGNPSVLCLGGTSGGALVWGKSLSSRKQNDQFWGGCGVGGPSAVLPGLWAFPNPLFGDRGHLGHGRRGSSSCISTWKPSLFGLGQRKTRVRVHTSPWKQQ